MTGATYREKDLWIQNFYKVSNSGIHDGGTEVSGN